MTDSAIATIDVIDVNESPSIDDQTFTIAENSVEGTVVGLLEAIDPDGDSLSFSITNTMDGDNDGNATFRIEGTQLVVNDSDDLDFETAASLPITVAVSDGTLTDETGVTVTLSDVDEIPEYIPFTLNFDTDAIGNLLAAGTTIDTEYQDMGITVSTPGHSYGAMIFDTANVTGGDYDLADPNIGNEPLNKVLILSEDGNSDNPDDNAKGGIFRFDFDELVGIHGVGLFDIDANETVEIRTFDDLGGVSEIYTFSGAGNNALQTANMNSGLITAMEVEFTGSGAISWVEGDRSSANMSTMVSSVPQNIVLSEQ
ncbi:cadherin repeat domain-containing protein [Okeania sp. SIO2G5]|uniref:cadherin repeat domain-containing protein n=1 Tax=Okeania sp. SIO2G5 TaxID=2607796 RepID=UPI0013C04AEE|nr:cadherin repeat domain-containing protein [Okeania sp. SIO2G5]NEP76440.1 cadherin repeat domain-containing protein [Okeania sp. SIO2G5]